MAAQQVTPRKILATSAGVLFLASLAFGGLRLWSASDNAPQAKAAVPDSADVAKAEQANPMNERSVVAAQPTPEKKQDKKTPERSKPAASGKDHEKPSILFMRVMDQLHVEAFQHFISQPGMGYSRIVPTVTLVRREWKIPEWTSEELAKEQAPLKGVKDLPLIHGLALKGFSDSNSENKPKAVNPNENRAKKELRWEIKSLDLIGLAMQDEPVVYVSDQIPKMKDLKKRPTRDMDLFESEGLEELMSGKSLYVRAKEGTIRVLGPINAANACLKCHRDAKEGTMLGAFSYTLRPAEYHVKRGGVDVPMPGVNSLPGGGGSPQFVPPAKKQ